MNPANTRTQMICLCCGPLGILVWLLGFALLGGLISPPSPHWTALHIQHFWQTGTDGKRAGLLLTMIGATLTGPWVAAISTQMKRIEGFYSPLSQTQLGMGMIGILLFIIPVMMMQAIAFRPHRDPSQMLLVNDMAWIPFVGVWCCAAVQNLAIGMAALKPGQTVFPRWVGYFNFWTALLFCPGSLLYFFKSGPFAWNGLLSWWFVVLVFTLWFGVMFVAMLGAIRSHAGEAAAAAQSEGLRPRLAPV
jgi:hypothetical protein